MVSCHVLDKRYSITYWTYQSLLTAHPHLHLIARPFSFQPGRNLIKGWTDGVLQMREGERALIHVPPQLGRSGNHTTFYGFLDVMFLSPYHYAMCYRKPIDYLTLCGQFSAQLYNAPGGGSEKFVKYLVP